MSRKDQFRRTLVMDLFTLVFCWGPILLAAQTALFFFRTDAATALKLLGLPAVYLLSFIFFTFIFRIFIPKLKAGVYDVGANAGFLTWFAHSMLTRAARVSGIHYALHSLGTFRWLYWRALGARVSYGVSTSYRVTLHDLPLLSIASGTILAEDVEISGHLIRGDRLLVAPVEIGEGVFIGRGTYVGPRTRIRDGAWIGQGNYLSGNVLEEKTRVGNHAWSMGKPRAPSEPDSD
jgi:acetyltransferase-like isoleucine patch superfamily enzyme